MCITVILFDFSLGNGLSKTDQKDHKRIRNKRYLGCFSVIGCMGSFVQIIPLRYNIDLFKIYDRLKGNSKRLGQNQ